MTKELRDLCTFSSHSLVRDPQFSRMDLVSCRNLLIYMDTDLQASVIPAFHYSLLPDGLLVLGNSETVGHHASLFAPLERQQRIYQRLNILTPAMKTPTRLQPAGPADKRKIATADLVGAVPRTSLSSAIADANGRVLERFAAPFAVILEDGTMLHYSSHVGRFKVFFEREPQESASDGYTVSHSPGLYLVSPEGDWLRQFDYGTPAAEILADLRSRL